MAYHWFLEARAGKLRRPQNCLVRLGRMGKMRSPYTIDLGTSSTTFSSVAAYHHVLEPEMPRLIIQFPVNWQTGSFYQLSEIAGANFLIFQPFPGAIRKVYLRHPLDLRFQWRGGGYSGMAFQANPK